MKVPLDDELVALLLLNSVQDRWDTLVVLVTNSAPDSLLTMQMAKHYLHNKESRRKEQEHSSKLKDFIVGNDKWGNTKHKSSQIISLFDFLCTFFNLRNHNQDIYRHHFVRDLQLKICQAKEKEYCHIKDELGTLEKREMKQAYIPNKSQNFSITTYSPKWELEVGEHEPYQM